MNIPAPDNAEAVAQWLAEYRDEQSGYFLELRNYISAIYDEHSFIEVCAQIRLNVEKWREILGDLVWLRLNSVLPDKADPEQEPESKATIGDWARKMSVDYYVLYQAVIAARNRGVKPEIATLPCTAQALIGRGTTDENREQVIGDRFGHVQTEFPDAPTEGVRKILAAEKVGLERLDLYSEECDGGARIWGVKSTGEPVAVLDLLWLDTDDDPQAKFYQGLAKSRIHIRRRN